MLLFTGYTIKIKGLYLNIVQLSRETYTYEMLLQISYIHLKKLDLNE